MAGKMWEPVSFIVRCYGVRIELRQINHLLLREQSFAQLRVVELLHGSAAFRRERGGDTRAVADGHPRGLDADRTVSDVRRRERDRHEQIRALSGLRRDRAV